MRKSSRFLVRSREWLRSTLDYRTLGLLALVSPLTACGFDPAHDYGVTSTWLLNGAVPDATRCAEFGIAQFRLTMNGPGPATTLEAPCDQTIRVGDLDAGGFETSISFDYGVEYAYTVDALDTNGKAIYRYEDKVLAFYGDFTPVDLATVDVFEPAGETASFSAQWVYTDGDLAADCARNRVKTVAIWLASATDPVLYDAVVLAEADCADGEFISDGKVLARGDYYFQYVALDGDTLVEQSEPIRRSVDEAGNLALPRHQFEGTPHQVEGL